MFNIPTDLTLFSVAGLTDMHRVAVAELTSLRASIGEDLTAATDEQASRATDLRQFALDVQAEIAKRNQRASAFTTIDSTDFTIPAVETAPAAQGATETLVASAGTTVVTDASGEDDSLVAASTSQVAQVLAVSPNDEVVVHGEVVGWLGEQHTLVAANSVPGLSDGAELESWNEFAKAFSARTRNYPAAGASTKVLQHPIAEIRRNYGEFTITDGMGDAEMNQILVRAADETRLEGGSLVAANGWCAPSETLYGTCLQISTDGLLSLPEVVARRGGIRHNQGIEFDTIFGTGTGFNILTEAQVIADVTKTCVEIPCPPFVDDRLDVSVLCLTGSILQNRAYPEFVETFVRGALATFAHFINRSVISQIVAGSTAVNLNIAIDPWQSDASVVSQLLAAVEMAVEDIRYRLRLPLTSTIEIVLPHWILAQMRADFSRRTGFDGVGLTDSAINSWFAMRGANVQFVYDWQDAFSGVATGPGADTPITVLPALVAPQTVQFLAYPAGTWVLARLDVIRLESIYDSVNLPQNLVTQLFMEDGFKPMRMCPLSRVYTVNICPSGATGATHAIACADVTP